MNIFRILAARRKRSNIRKYITLLGPALASRYGKATYYSPEQVWQTIHQENLSETESEYALVIYCSPKTFAADQMANGRVAQYWPLRVEIMEYDFRHGRTWEQGSASENLSAADQDARAGYLPG